MGTHCVVEFKGDKADADNVTRVNDRVQLYVHSDGYPTYMIPLLTDFLKWNHPRNDDISYTAANFIYWYKKRALKSARAMAREYPAKPKQHNGFLLQVEHIGVGVLPLMTKKEMYNQCMSYFYEVHLHDGLHEPEIKEVPIY